MEQLSFLDFPVVKFSFRDAGKENIRDEWLACWGWDGPVVGEPLQVNHCTAIGVDGVTGYWYGARCIAEQEFPGDVWLVRVEYGRDAPPHCRENNGTRLLLALDDIWPPVDDLTAEMDKRTCADCGCEIGFDSGPPDGWELEDGRTICQRCYVSDTKMIVNEVVKLS